MFTSARERRLWLWAALSVILIYASLGYLRTPTEWLRERNLLRLTVAAVFLVAVILVVRVLLRRRPGRTELAVLAAVAVVYLVVLLCHERVEERVHYLEYGLVGGLVYSALLERRANRRPKPPPPRRPRPWAGPAAVLITAAAGWGDEGIQAILPDRVYELRDVAMNVSAGILIVAAMAARSWARRRDAGRRASV